MNRLDIIQSIIKKIGARTYLEIGTSQGDVFFRVRAGRKIGMDPNMPGNVVK